MRNWVYRGQPDAFSPVDPVDLGGDGGGDVDLAVSMPDPTTSALPSPPTLAASSLIAANISTQRSTDKGQTFTQNNLGNASGGVPGAREAAATGGPDVFPFAIDEAALRRGRERFQIYCIVCHGATGEGDGMVVRRGYQKPPSYYDDRLQEGTTPAAHFFDVITNGWGAMPSYAEQIPAEDRWKIIAYIRALQLSRKLKLPDLSPEEQQKVLSGAQERAGGEAGGSELQSPQPGGQPAQVEGNH
ncbi:MAG: cytochrome c [Acidobacteriota bacterium]|nr:cytochrome c [Acidobacteriota bacterium]